MKRIVLLASVFGLFACSKSKEDNKECYLCKTYRERTYDDGRVVKDTIPGLVCQTTGFIDAYIKNGTFTGRYWSQPDNDSVNMKMYTTCEKR